MSEPVRPVKLETPLQGQKWTNADGTATAYAHRYHHAVFMRVGAYNDDVWRALGVGFTGLVQINQVNQRVSDVEAATAAVQGAVAGLRGDPRLDDAVRALEVAITALVQVQARASGETEKRLSELGGLVTSFGARLTKAIQGGQTQVDNLQLESRKAQQFQTASIQRVASTQLTLEDELDRLSGGFDADVRSVIAAFITPSAVVDPSAAGQLVIEATNNNTLTFKLQGTDDVVRSGTITLS